MKVDWHAFFSTYRNIDVQSDSDLLFQVGYTVGGRAITRPQFDALLGDIDAGLSLCPEDDLLDLCCGNGLITHEVAQKVGSVLGIDFSEPYIRNATRLKQRSNLRYICADLCGAELPPHLSDRRWTKVLMYYSLAYFTVHQFERLLDLLKPHVADGARMLVGSVPDSGRKWSFYNTWRRQIAYIWNVKCLQRESGIGQWWSRKTIHELCRKKGLLCEFRDESPVLHTAHYRFDAVVTFGPSASNGVTA